MDWADLRHAYGAAGDVPALLTVLSPDASAPVWEELWSRLCHQGTVYTASFAALPLLLESAARWQATDRAMVLSLAGAILASKDVIGPPRSLLLAPHQNSILQFEQLALESLEVGDMSDADFVHVAQATLAFRGDPLWGSQLDRLLDGEFEGECPECGACVMAVVGEYGCFLTTEEWFGRPEPKRLPIAPMEASSLSGVGGWLYEAADRADHDVVAEWVRYLFGRGTCPECAEAVEIEGVIRQAARPNGARTDAGEV